MSKVKKGTKYVSNKVDLIHVNVATQQYFDSNNKPIKIKSEEARQKNCKFNSVKKKWLSSTDEELIYNVTILIPKESNEAKKIKQLVDEEWEKGKAAKVIKKNSRYPLEDGDDKADELEAKEKNGEYYRGNYVIKAKSLFKPLIVLGKKVVKPSTDTFDIDHNGWTGRVSLRFDYYSGMGGGITTRLNQICFLEDNPDLDFGGGCNFEIEEEDEQTDFGNNVANNETVNTGIQSCYQEEDEEDEEPPVM